MLDQGNRPAPMKFGATYKSVTALAAVTPVAVFTAASNLRGAILHSADMVGLYSGALPMGSGLIAKATAPTSIVDGEVIAAVDAVNQYSTDRYASISVQDDIFIPAGLGLYFIARDVEAYGARSCRYTLL